MADTDFTFVSSGDEGTDFLVTFPTPRANDRYFVSASLSKVASVFAFDMPRDQRSRTQFRVITTAPMQAGDTIEFHVYDPAGARRTIQPARLLLVNGTGIRGTSKLEITSPGGQIQVPIVPPRRGRVTQIEATVQALSANDSVILEVGEEFAISRGTTPQTLSVDVNLVAPELLQPPAVPVFSLKEFGQGGRIFYVFMTVEFED